MNAPDLKVGDSVVIEPKGDFFAFVAGWRGTFTGWNNGHAVIECPRADGTKTLFVPPDQLVLSVGA